MDVFSRDCDPERLPEIAEALRNLAGDETGEIARLSRDFSRVVSAIKTPGPWKETAPHRLIETEKVLCSYLRPLRREVAFVDIGGSDGVTTLETVQMLQRELAVPVTAHMVDKYLQLSRYQRGPLREYRLKGGHPVLVRVGRFGLFLSPPPNRHGTRRERLASAYLRSKLLRNALSLGSTISLVNPRVRAESAIAVLEADCLEHQPSLIDKFDASRVSNVLNPAYFSQEQLQQALANLHRYLHEEGLLVISRNYRIDGGEIERGSVWKKSGSRFVRQEDFAGGSEIADQVDHLHCE